jgi:hypothetical protein
LKIQPNRFSVFQKAVQWDGDDADSELQKQEQGDLDAITF